MNPVPDPNDVSQRALDVAEWLAKLAGAMAILGGFIRGVYVPFRNWRERVGAKRQEVLALQVRALLGVELKTLQFVAETADQTMQILRDMQADHAMLLELAKDNREWHSETNDLLSALGLESDRRGEERRTRADVLIDSLEDRRRQLRRKGEQIE